MNPVVHFEMPFVDKDKMTDFYTKAFGWKAQSFGEEFGNYVVLETSEMDPNTKMPTKPGRINGGFFPKAPGNTHPSLVIGVEDINTAMKKVTDAGGTLTGGDNGKPVNIPGIGLYVGFIDPEGNRGSILQPMGM
jgi:predicted enzyme related to lactoylglutathione lyase